MSTSETDVIPVRDCPCGKGKISMHIVTQDNPWSRPDISYELQCNECSRDWKLSGKSLISRKDEAAYTQAVTLARRAHEHLENIVAPLVNEHFRNFAAKSAVAEHREMERLHLKPRSLRDFRAQRSAGGSPYHRCYPLINRDWVMMLVDAAGQRAEYNTAQKEVRSAEQLSENAYRDMRRLKIDT